MQNADSNAPKTRFSDPLQKKNRQFSRQNVAWAILGVMMAAIALGVLRKAYQHNAYNYWQARLVHGEPVVMRFICGTDVGFNCNDQIKITYQKRGDQWCETLWRNTETEPTRARWCNANPKHESVNLYGELYSFTRYGAVTKAGHLVGQMFLQ